MPRPQQGRDVSNDIWASDIHVTPDGRFLYAAERTSSTINGFTVDTASGKLTYLGSARRPRSSRAASASIPPGASWSCPARSRRRISTYAIDSNGALKPIGKVADRQGLELGRDRQLRLKKGMLT